MTEQEITQARSDVDQLDIEQLRCGVLLQLLKIEALKKERDALAANHKECVQCLGEALQDSANLAAAAKLALDALKKVHYEAINSGVNNYSQLLGDIAKAHDALKAGAQ